MDPFSYIFYWLMCAYITPHCKNDLTASGILELQTFHCHNHQKYWYIHVYIYILSKSVDACFPSLVGILIYLL